MLHKPNFMLLGPFDSMKDKSGDPGNFGKFELSLIILWTYNSSLSTSAVQNFADQREFKFKVHPDSVATK